MANEYAKCLKNLGVNISSVISSKNSKTVDHLISSYDINHKFQDINDILVNQGIWDAAIICCSAEYTFSYLEKLAIADKPILAEKPISSNITELEKIIHFKNIVVGFNRRFYKNISYLKSELANKNIDLVKLCIPDLNISDILTKHKYLPDSVYSNSIHIFDLLLYLFGDVSWQSSVISKTNKSICSLSLLGFNKANINFSLDFPFNYPDNFSITIYAEETSYVIKPIEILRVFKGMDIQEPSGDIPHRIYKPRLKNLIVAESNEKFKPGLHDQVESFIEFCKYKTFDYRLATIYDAKCALNSIINIENLIKQ